jgi:hypothetical protein
MYLTPKRFMLSEVFLFLDFHFHLVINGNRLTPVSSQIFFSNSDNRKLPMLFVLNTIGFIITCWISKMYQNIPLSAILSSLNVTSIILTIIYLLESKTAPLRLRKAISTMLLFFHELLLFTILTTFFYPIKN